MSHDAVPMDIVVLGLSITSSWGNGHATTYRSLVRALHDRGHRVLFLERDAEWYRNNRDLPAPRFCQTEIYGSVPELERFSDAVREADLVIVGSFVPDGVAVGDWVLRTAHGVRAFYDIDTPITLSRLDHGTADYVTRQQVASYDLYLSFTGGPAPERLEREFGSPMARPLYCSADPDTYFHEEVPPRWDLGYMGTYSDDRQPALERLLLEPARQWRAGRFAVVGPMYPDHLRWPPNVWRDQHLAPRDHRGFYSAQRYTLNVTRAHMVTSGFSPSVRLFEAAACGTPIVTDWWNGLETIFEPGDEILVARSTDEVLTILHDLPEAERVAIGARARDRVVREHTAVHRAVQLERYVGQLTSRSVGP